MCTFLQNGALWDMCLIQSDLWDGFHMRHLWLWQWLVNCSVPSHYPNQCWRLLNWTLGNIIQWNLNQKTIIHIEENGFEDVICKMLAIFSKCEWVIAYSTAAVNTLRPRQNGLQFADDIFKCIFFNENVWIAIRISLGFVPKSPINDIPALV